MRILLVDDNIDSADLLATFLRQEGHDTSVAYDVADALNMARATRPRLAILDIGLPQVDGYELARTLRSEFGETLRLFALSAFSSDASKLRARAVGIEHYFVKPVDLDELAGVITGLRDLG